MADEPAKDSPYDQKASDVEARRLVQVDKAYRNEEFLMSRDARSIRILCEFEETLTRLQRQGVLGTFLFFGSARAMYRNDWEAELAASKAKQADKARPQKERDEATAKIDRLSKTEWLCDYMVKAEKLSRLLTEWAMTEEMRAGGLDLASGGHSLQANVPSYLCEHVAASGGEAMSLATHPQRYVVSTGGGPGLMEAANRGASKVPGSRSAGFAISLPFEKGLNPYVTPQLAFSFHYFFTRKYWMMYPAKVLIALPGGFGTFDELFESVTLKQTGKKPPFPIVLIGKKYWSEVVDWTALEQYGTISAQDRDQFFITDEPMEAFEFIKRSLLSNGRSSYQTPRKRSYPASEKVDEEHLGRSLKKMREDFARPQTPKSPTQAPVDA